MTESLSQPKAARRGASDLRPPQHADGASRDRRPLLLIVLIGALYFAQGIPLGFIFQAFPAMLRREEAPLELIAWVPALGLPWAFKFLWAPMVDSRWSPSLGRRRSWLLSMQVLMMAAMGGIALWPLGPASSIVPMLLLLAASTVSATQDIATDGLAAERLGGGALVSANVLSVGGMMAGVMVGGGGTLLVVETLGYEGTVFGLVAILGTCAIPVLLWVEPPSSDETVAEGASLLRGIKRPRFLSTLAVSAFYAAGHITGTTLTKLFLVDRDWPLDRIGALATIDGFAMIMLGCGTASWLLMKIGAWRSIQVGLVLCVTALSALLAFAGGYVALGFPAIAVVSAVSGGGLGLAAVAIYTIAMRFSASGHQTGTDVTLFKSANVVGEIAAASLATMVAAKAGYALGFGFGLAAALVTILLAAMAKRKANLFDDGHDAAPAGTAPHPDHGR